MGTVILVAFIAHHTPSFGFCDGIWQITWVFSMTVACHLV